MKKVELGHMLAARDRRVDIQNKMLEESGGEGCLVCLTLNIAGEIKRTPMTKMLFDRGVSDFEQLGLDIKCHKMIDEFTGNEAFWLVGDEGADVKSRLEDIEDSFPAARLFDFDVLKAGGAKLSRSKSRRCLICDKPAAECARSRAHGLDAVKSATQSLLRDFCADALADMGRAALLDELYTTPKPGLVDLNNNGAHDDMDVALFEKSADALRPYFRDAALLGMEGSGMDGLRRRGLAAEKEMFAATGGVNTHKGMIYSMGLLLAGAGMALSSDDPCNEDINTVINGSSGVQAAPLYERTVACAAGLACEDAERMLARARACPSTNGGAVLKKYGAAGAIGHAAAGFPDALYCAGRLRYYMEEKGADRYEAGALALCDSMARLDDTNILHRGGREGLEFTKQQAAAVCALPAEERIPALRALDKEMIARGLSPGGSADMLALAFFMVFLQNRSQPGAEKDFSG